MKYEGLQRENRETSSAEIKNRVDIARKIQIERYKSDGIVSNSELTPKLIEKYCKLDDRCNEIMKKAFENMGLSARAYSKILKVARTIADIEIQDDILPKHILEAIQYRSLDRKYWNR